MVNHIKFANPQTKCKLNESRFIRKTKYLTRTITSSQFRLRQRKKSKCLLFDMKSEVKMLMIESRGADSDRQESQNFSTITRKLCARV